MCETAYVQLYFKELRHRTDTTTDGLPCRPRS